MTQEHLLLLDISYDRESLNPSFYCMHEPTENPEDLCDGYFFATMKDDFWEIREEQDLLTKGPVNRRLTVIESYWQGEEEDAELYWTLQKSFPHAYEVNLREENTN